MFENRNGPYSSLRLSAGPTHAAHAALAGAASGGHRAGAGGVLFLQTNYGPQRLTVEQSEQLHSELSAANLERQRLQSQLEETTQQRDANKTGHEKLTSDLAEARSKIDALNKELVLFQDAMPPDPRGGNLGIRSATFARAPGLLDFQVLVMREERQGAPFKGTLTFHRRQLSQWPRRHHHAGRPDAERGPLRLRARPACCLRASRPRSWCCA